MRIVDLKDAGMPLRFWLQWHTLLYGVWRILMFVAIFVLLYGLNRNIWN